jgi:hypothetical protein
MLDDLRLPRLARLHNLGDEGFQAEMDIQVAGRGITMPQLALAVAEVERQSSRIRREALGVRHADYRAVFEHVDLLSGMTVPNRLLIERFGDFAVCLVAAPLERMAEAWIGLFPSI